MSLLILFHCNLGYVFLSFDWIKTIIIISNARDMLGGEMLKLRFDSYISFAPEGWKCILRGPDFKFFPETHAFGACSLLKILLKTLDLLVYTSSCVAFFLTQWEKSTVIFPTRPRISFWPRTFSNNFLVTWAHKEFAYLS